MVMGMRVSRSTGFMGLPSWRKSAELDAAIADGAEFVEF
jgi:hypothetical protein